ncbi:MAG TPA: hypothetical protein VKH41_05365 [Myxococcota bacterium]|nr:hypothetical protein [Myxococcota bacterium]
MDEAGQPRGDQPQPEADRDLEVLAVGLAHGARMVGEAARKAIAHHWERYRLPQAEFIAIYSHY